MINSEYVKSMNCNFERIKLEEKPEEKKYQYCIVNRGGISGLLPCSLRVINGDAYLYYDITSRQGLSQIFRKKQIGRQWIKDFIWNLKRISQELNRFLLDKSNVIWYPEQIFQDLEDNRWSFLYYPYFDGDNGFRELLDFIIDKIDYSDDVLVECVYKIYEQYESFGEDYLSEKIYKDAEMLDEYETEEFKDSEVLEDGKLLVPMNSNVKSVNNTEETDNTKTITENSISEKGKKSDLSEYYGDLLKGKVKDKKKSIVPVKEKRGLLSFFERSKKKDKDLREKNRRNNHYILDTGMNSEIAVKVAEESDFYKYNNESKEVGKTVYIENVAEDKDNRKRIYDSDGKMLRLLAEDSLVIGKKKDEADMVIENSSISRIHARIYYADGEYMLEDLNSTNGTFKNGLRLKPYEKRKLASGDEIKLGSVALMYN